jgi:hypothetical protein
LKATAAASAQVRRFCFHKAIPGIKLSHHVYTSLLLCGQIECIHQTEVHLTQHQSLRCCASSDDCWLFTMHSQGLEYEWQEFVLPYDHGEPRCSHTACLFPTADELLIHSGSTQPFYETRLKLKVNTVFVCSFFRQVESILYCSILLHCVDLTFSLTFPYVCSFGWHSLFFPLLQTYTTCWAKTSNAYLQ